MDGKRQAVLGVYSAKFFPKLDIVNQSKMTNSLGSKTVDGYYPTSEYRAQIEITEKLD
ncbi:MAG: hypothetical protein F6K55_03085 [Moorea sp. SIO4A3]|nr:hypothetical protein [Moorena sp. SIO4A3]